MNLFNICLAGEIRAWAPKLCRCHVAANSIPHHATNGYHFLVLASMGVNFIFHYNSETCLPIRLT